MAKKLRIEATLDASGVQTGAKKAETALGGLKKAALALGIVLGGHQVLGGLKASLAEFTKNEAAYKRVEARVNALGLSYKNLAPEIRRTIDAQSTLAKVADVEIVDAFNKLLTASGSYETAMANLPLVLDIAATKMFDTSGAALNLARVLSGSAGELSEKFAGLADEMGRYTDKAARAKAGVAFLQGRVGGTAAATAGDTLESAYSGFNDAVGDFKNSVGSFFAPGAKMILDAGEKFLRTFTPPGNMQPGPGQETPAELSLKVRNRMAWELGQPEIHPGEIRTENLVVVANNYTQPGFTGPPHPGARTMEQLGLQSMFGDARWDLPLQGIRGDRRGFTGGGGLGPGADFGPPVEEVEDTSRERWKKEAEIFQQEMERVQQQLAAQFGSAIGQGMVDLLSGDGKKFVDGIANMFKRSLAQILGDLVTSGLTGNPYGLAKAFLK